MTREERDVVVTVHLVLDEATWDEADSVIRDQGWQEEEGLRILLGYGAAVHLDPPERDLLHALGALRAELATLRHRAFRADEAVRTLRMNLTGLEASVAQARRSLRWLEREVADLRERAREAGVALPEEAPPDPQEDARRRLRDLFARGRSRE
jgi:hypothetical protein